MTGGDAPILAAATLVLLMQCGFALMVSGFARARNVGHTIVSIVVLNSAALIGYCAIGAAFLSSRSIFLALVATVAASAPAGALAERWRFRSMVIVALFLSAVIFPLAVRWIWADGFLGAIDFAGSGVVYLVGGAAALAGVLVVGPRVGKFGRDGQPRAMPGHHVPMFIVGSMLVAIGGIGIAAGRGVALEAGATTAIMNLVLGSAASVLAATAYMSWRFSAPDASLVANALVGGVVSTAAGCAVVPIWAAVAIGAVAGPLVVGSVIVVERRLRLDDASGIVSTHGTCGVWGLLAAGAFSGGAPQLAAQAGAAAIVFVLAFGTSYAVFVAIGYTLGNRVSHQAEIEGLDVAELGTNAYPEFGVVESPYDSRR